MRIATWNVNSIGARLPRVLDWLDTAQPDVVALQELKTTTEAFPHHEIEQLGYEVAAHGQGRWNGVALLSRVGLTDVVRDLPGQPDYEGLIEARAIGATCGGIRVWSVYVPNGREPDHDHYRYKLQWLDTLRDTVGTEQATSPELAYAVIGDFNVAPTDADVWDVNAFVGSTHITEAERARLNQLQQVGLVDIYPRSLKGEPYTFWDYRNGSFYKGFGMRIDLIMANEVFRQRIKDTYVDRDARKGKQPSDHAPVVVDLN